MSMAEDELDKLASLFSKDGEMGEDEERDFRQGLMGQVEKLKLWISDKVDQRVGDVMKMMKLVSREEFETLSEMVSSLESRVQDLEKKPRKPEK
jgi:polyhydroxyalkanoate synthesis regulator phasin